GFRQAVVPLPIREVAVIVLLVDYLQISAGIHDRPALGAGMINHPIIPSGAAYGEIRKLLKARAWKDKVIAASAGMQASLDKQALLQRCQALRVKAQGLLHAQIPAPSDH